MIKCNNRNSSPKPCLFPLNDKIRRAALSLLSLVSSLLGDLWCLQTVLFQFDLFCSCVHTCDRSQLATSMRASISAQTVANRSRSTRTNLWDTLCLTRKQAARITYGTMQMYMWRNNAAHSRSVRHAALPLWGPKIHNRAHKSPPLHPITSRFNLIIIFTSDFYFSSRLSLGLINDLFPRSSNQNVMFISHFTPLELHVTLLSQLLV